MSSKLIGCQTCLYMATHEKCTGCIEQPIGFVYKGDGKFPPFTYHHYQEGNWMDRIIQAQIDGTHNIVIGGQGEAEVNTKWGPELTTKTLDYVSEQCGYVTGRLHSHSDATQHLTIYTTESLFELVWDKDGHLLTITDKNNPDNGWSWENVNPFRQAS